MKIMFHSNAPWVGSGYGQQGRIATRDMRAHGHDVAFSAFYGLQGTGLIWDGMPIYPSLVHPFGADVIHPHCIDHFGDDLDGVCIALCDIFTQDARVYKELTSAAWVPVDHAPVPPRVVQWFQDASGTVPIAMSRFGREELQRALPDRHVEYVPHSFDATELYPTNQNAARDALGLPQGVPVVGMVAANKGNPSRKSFDVVFQAFKILLTDKPDAILYIHSERDGVMGGVNLGALADACGIPKSSVWYAPQYHMLTGKLGAEHMRNVYGALDVFVNPAMGEGFGVPIIEAQACGIPAIVGDWTAMRELQPYGALRVQGQALYTAQNSWQWLPNVTDLYAAIAGVLRSDVAELAVAAVDTASEYESEFVFTEYWLPVLERLADQLGVSRSAQNSAVAVTT